MSAAKGEYLGGSATKIVQGNIYSFFLSYIEPPRPCIHTDTRGVLWLFRGKGCAVAISRYPSIIHCSVHRLTSPLMLPPVFLFARTSRRVVFPAPDGPKRATTRPLHAYLSRTYLIYYWCEGTLCNALFIPYLFHWSREPIKMHHFLSQSECLHAMR